MKIESPSLLITDDDPAFRETLRVVFEPEGYRTLLAGTGEEALDIVRNQEVHLVLLDMHMPRLTGLETLRQVKQFRAMLTLYSVVGPPGRVAHRTGAAGPCVLGPLQAGYTTSDHRRCPAGVGTHV